MKNRIEVGLFDGSFRGAQTMNVRAKSWAQFPKYFSWARNEWRDATVFTDMYIFSDESESNRIETKIAWILEPDFLDKLEKDEIEYMNRNFDFILTSDMTYIEAFRNHWRYAPVGGLWVTPQSYQQKSDVISMMTTQKQKAPGHKFRSEIMEAYRALDKPGFEMNFFGRGSVPIEDKTMAIGPYRYTVVIESHQIPGYFTEKIIDAFASYTVPIYWGDTRITNRFDHKGIMTFNNVESLFSFIEDSERLKNLYEQYFDHTCANFKLAQRYYCAEDWVFEEYPWMFI